MSTKTCIQKVIDSRTHAYVYRRRPHVLPDYTGDKNNGYARCEACGELCYVGTGYHPNLHVLLEQADAEAAFQRKHRVPRGK